MAIPDLALSAGPGAPSAPPVVRRAASSRNGMRTKGWILLACLFAYLAIMGTLLLTRMHATLASQEALAAQAAAAAVLDRDRALLEHAGTDPAGVARLATTARAATAALEARVERFRLEQQRDAVLLIGVGLVGIALLGAAVFAFLSRTVADVRALIGRTGGIVAGRVPAPMPPTRFDELGELAAAIDELGVALQRRERDLELERRKGFHREKMAAIGSLAAGVLTEIGNPIAAIDGLARAMRESPGADGQAASDSVAPEAILEQTARLMVVTRQIAEFTAPQPSRRELIDVNGVVERALGLLRFDDAMRGIEVELALDRQLGAIAGMTDRLVQLLMNLIGNAADALHAGRAARPNLRIATRREGDDVVLEVSDNGTGMSDEVRRRAFEPFFSTKPAGRGTGLGLPLCQSIAADHGGRIDLASAAGVGTCVTIRLPLAPVDTHP